jgi:hypothetical protein
VEVLVSWYLHGKREKRKKAIDRGKGKG